MGRSDRAHVVEALALIFEVASSLKGFQPREK